jgi:proteasome accessory factor A
MTAPVSRSSSHWLSMPRPGSRLTVRGEIYVFKNNTDSAGNSYGCHENYLVRRGRRLRCRVRGLLPFLISRQLICGAGKIVHTSKGATYALSQRADHIWEGVSSATTRSRPIINTRDEPHADAEQYPTAARHRRRLQHERDHHLLKVGSADLVLRMLESGVMRDLTLENPIRAIREISHDLTGRRSVRLTSG